MTLRAPGLPRGTVGGPHVSALKAVDAGGRVGLPAPGHILSSARGRQGVLRVQMGEEQRERESQADSLLSELPDVRFIPGL